MLERKSEMKRRRPPWSGVTWGLLRRSHEGFTLPDRREEEREGKTNPDRECREREWKRGCGS